MTALLTNLLVLEVVAAALVLGAAPPSLATLGAPTPSTNERSSTATRMPHSGCVDRVEDLPESPLYQPDDRRLRAPHVLVVLKSRRRLLLFRHGKAATDERAHRCWPVALGSAATGTKQEQGDFKTPEGWYRTSDKPWSRFSGAIAIHYPNARDAGRGLRAGLLDERDHERILRALDRGLKPPQNTALGGEILIHGGGSSSDWTQGCVALDDPRLLELRAALPDKSVDILILP